MVNRYTSDRRVRSDDAYTPDGVGGKRPDRSVIVYAQRVREAFKDVPLVIGGIEASLRRIAHFDYWSEKIRRSILLDAKADMLVYGNGERQICEIAHRLAKGEDISTITDIRGTSFTRKSLPEGWVEINSAHLDAPGPLNPPVDPYAMEPSQADRRARQRYGHCRERATRAGRALRAAREERGSWQQCHPAAVLRTGRRGPGALRACLAHPASGIQSR